MAESRKAHFKKTFRSEGVPQRLRRQSDEIRKQKRNTAFETKRIKTHPEDEILHEYTQEEFMQITTDIKSVDIPTRLQGLQKLRKLLCSKTPPIGEAITNGIIPYLQDSLQQHQVELQSEAAWCLANLATGTNEQAQQILCTIVPILHILSTTTTTAPPPPHHLHLHLSLQEQCCWMVGNIASDGDEFRFFLLEHGCVSIICNHIRALLSILHNTTTTPTSSQSMSISNLPPLPPDTNYSNSNISNSSFVTNSNTSNKESVAVLLSALHTATWALSTMDILFHLCTIPEGFVSVEAAWTLAFLTVREDQRVDALLLHPPGIVQALLHGASSLLLLQSHDINSSSSNGTGNGSVTAHLVPFLRCLENLTAGPDRWVEKLLEGGGKAAVLQLLTRATDCSTAHRAVIKDAIWVISNLIPLKPNMNMMTVTDKNTLLGMLIQVLQSNSDQFDIEREAVLSVRNASHASDLDKTVYHNYLREIAPLLVKLLKVPDQEVSLAGVQLLAHHCCPDLSDTDDLTPQHPHHVRVNAMNANQCRSLGLMDALDDLQYGQCEEQLRRAAGLLAEVLYADEEEGVEGVDGGGVREGSGMTMGMTMGMGSGSGLGRGKHMTAPAQYACLIMENRQAFPQAKCKITAQVKPSQSRFVSVQEIKYNPMMCNLISI
eukprot:gene5313-10624_t